MAVSATAWIQAQETGTGDIPPWGRLARTPIYLEASRRIVDALPLPSPQPRWSFPESELSILPDLLLKAGLQPSMVSALTRPERVVRSEGWLHLFPSQGDVLTLDPGTRSDLYALLGRHEINEFYHSPVLILTDTVEEWYQTSRLRRDLVDLVARLSCRRGNAWAFSDVALLMTQVRGEEEARQLFKSFTRTRAYLIRLEIDAGTDSAGLRNYWSVGGSSSRTKDLEPLIESLQATGEEIRLDFAHILPPLARKLLYTYPSMEQGAQGIMPDCHWTSLNFFNYEGHGYLLDAGLATSKVLQDYAPVEPPYVYGDILFFLDKKEGNAFHSCLYLAEDLVYTKNGRNSLVPWIISTLEDVSEVYLWAVDGRVQGYRQRALLNAEN